MNARRPTRKKESTRRPSPRAAAARRAPTEAPASVLRGISAALRRRDGDVDVDLLSGAHASDLEAYFGEELYSELRDLARSAASRSVRGAPRVLILPGIMGSKLGFERALLDDVVWLDPKEIVLGNLTLLALGSSGRGRRIRPLGVLLLAYLKLKLRLRAEGFDADFWPYDWRQRLDDLGRDLVRRLSTETAPEVHLVCHSMGGLVARAALKLDGRKVGRVVQLGTPNYGSFAPVQALKGLYSVVRQVAFFDPFHSAEELAKDVFSTFPGLYSLLAAPAKFSRFDLYDARAWPQEEPLPRATLLSEARRTQELLAPARDGFHLIAGVNEGTVTDLRIEDGELVYVETPDGDGTVPLTFAELPGATTHYVEESHGSLPNHRDVARAVADLLLRGETEALPLERPARRQTAPRAVRHSDLLGAGAAEGRRGEEPSPRVFRRLLDPVASAQARNGAGAPVQTLPPSLKAVQVSRSRQHHVDLILARGSITEVDARAVVLGVYRDVSPTGSARAMDERLGGAISEATARRMFSGGVGEIFVLPTGRHPVRPDFVVFAGLGPFDQFRPQVLRVVAENVLRTLVRTNVEDLATVLLTGASAEGASGSVKEALVNLLEGFFRGLLDADKRRQFRRITICQRSPEHYEVLRRELYALTSTALFDRVNVTFDEVELPPAPVHVSQPTRLLARSPDPVYLTVREEAAKGSGHRFTSALLTAGGKATVISGEREVGRLEWKRLETELERLAEGRGDAAAFGKQLSGAVLPEAILAAFPAFRDRHLIVVHDEGASRVPWESLGIDGIFPAAEGGMSRKYMAKDLSVAKWLEERREDGVLSLLLVVNPTEDLDGAEREAERVKALFGTNGLVRIDARRRGEARKERLLADFASGLYDVIHYAGHAFFDAEHPARSGIVCAGGKVLSGADLAGVGNLPSLVFFNACEAGRLRAGRSAGRRVPVRERVVKNVGLAEAFLRGGVANYVGTYWPVGDAPAADFAAAFYAELLRGRPLGAAALAGRSAVRSGHPSSPDWADYILYGSHEFVLKVQERA